MINVLYQVCYIILKVLSITEKELADILIVNGNPLNNINVLTQIKYVIKNGIIIFNNSH
jgi:imidazolonepropionase-like amidohydrolase